MWLPILCWSSLLAFCAGQTYEQSAAVDTTKPAVRKLILDLINECRKGVQPPATNMLEVTWNVDAEKTAKTMVRNCKFKHSGKEQRTIPGFACGENLYQSNAYPGWAQAIKAFCDEKDFFTYGGQNKDPSKQTGHYTQVVWYNSHMVGCAAAYCPGGMWLYACHHCPPGNIAPVNKPYETGKSCDKCKGKCSNKLCTNPCSTANLARREDCEGYKDRYCDQASVKQNCKASCECRKGEIY